MKSKNDVDLYLTKSILYESKTLRYLFDYGARTKDPACICGECND